MDRLPGHQQMGLSDKEYTLIADYIYQRAGIYLGSNKQELVKARLMKRLRFYGFRSFGQYYDYVSAQRDGTELVEMINAITTNVTSFFRENQHFEYIRKELAPQMLAEKRIRHVQRIRLWSAACATGEEPYTMMITMMEAMGGNTTGWDLKELATDISTKALTAAQAGRYTRQKVTGISPALVHKYFERKDHDGEVFFVIKDFMKRFVTFRKLNLMMPRFPFSGKFDIIFCRNVMIYFDRETQERLVNKLSDVLESGGHLFIGHSESLAGFAKNHLRSVAPAIFQKM